MPVSKGTAAEGVIYARQQRYGQATIYALPRRKSLRAAAGFSRSHITDGQQSQQRLSHTPKRWMQSRSAARVGCSAR